MTDFLKSEFERLVGLIPATDPRTADYQMLLRSIECLDALGQTVDAVAAPLEEAAAKVIPFTKAEFPEDPAVDPVVEEKDEEKAAEEKAAEDISANEPEPEPAPVVEEKTYTSAEVRKALVDARGRGVDVKAVLAKVGADNFTAVPASKYAALMDALNGAN